ncbi:ABC transporter ATP-binding protein/permease [Clostridium tagluense]|uniref:ABC transporter ATP-binding protein n=1 Tax=Clostridium tagluense TaxID=360422 RepID=UPI001CF5C882|nr:ABC transporter ATP-binding protein [Clostridium tagluense]MCB2312172.1 ABC transporter ATP-binding protein/permease [Clostridium tagluense]MCB2316759.1 ABC transporter ATP-binding protein/permease [Clostridium tagluense]MCB2321619.1 ABC transporter ATP-binding protein/permease [Clostridium tagluense]MCB2326628.1 ABC transporter ATP-binding protein/permease [Clostridium tagluense]MCB2331351.1 ABC transporter ATP-binding protein/permease [Clostridium tagluense]
MGKSIIVDFIKKHKISYIIGILFMFLTSYIQSFFPRVLGDTIDILGRSNFNLSLVKMKIVYILLITTGTFISTYAWRNLIVVNGRNLECHLREKLYNHFQKLSPEFYNKRKTGDLIAYAINDISAVRMTLGPATAMIINGIAICSVSIYSMSKIMNLKFTLMILMPIPFIIFFMLKIGGLVQKRFRVVQENFASISGRVQENIYGIRVIKSYVQEEAESKKFEILNDAMMDSNISMVKVSASLSPVIEISFSISFVMNLIIGGNMVLNGGITLGDFIAFNGYLTMIMRPIISIGRVINIVQRGIASIKRLDEIFNVNPEICDGEKMISTNIEGKIEFKNLSFSYTGSDKNALQNINLKIPKGYTLGITGKTGSGKTTLVNLLLKLYMPSPEEIFIDSVDINDYCLATLRSSIGYVPQDNFLFSASIKENIKFFKDIYTDDQIEKAAIISSIYESIMDFPKGFDTNLSERGVNLSGGEKQRISIARAIIRDPSILILDDSLSAVDTITESKLLKNIKKCRGGKTTIIVAHRISTIKDADFIIVLDEGNICENGTHNELIKKGGLYYETYKSQHEEIEKKSEWEVS